MYAPLWGADIHAEWMRNLLIDRPDIDPGVLERTRAVMDRHFPEAVVKGYETLVATLTGEGRRGHTLAPATEAGDEILARLDCAAGSASGVDLTVSPYALSHGRIDRKLPHARNSPSNSGKSSSSSSIVFQSLPALFLTSVFRETDGSAQDDVRSTFPSELPEYLLEQFRPQECQE